MNYSNVILVKGFSGGRISIPRVSTPRVSVPRVAPTPRVNRVTPTPPEPSPPIHETVPVAHQSVTVNHFHNDSYGGGSGSIWFWMWMFDRPQQQAPVVYQPAPQPQGYQQAPVQYVEQQDSRQCGWRTKRDSKGGRKHGVLKSQSRNNTISLVSRLHPRLSNSK